MAGHQDARYIPPRRERDNPRRGRDDGFFSIRWVVLTAVVVTLVVIFLIDRPA
jgi:hypothetical protein